MSKARTRWLAALAALGIVVSPNLNGAAGAQAVQAAPTVASVKPNATNNLDCNGLSPKYKPVRLGIATCTDPKQIESGGDTYRFEDNGRYIGHDEPSVKFISSTPGSGNNMTYFMRLGRDTNQPPTLNTNQTSRYGELSVAPWFGLPICDPKSYPQNPCTPDSDSNIGDFTSPAAAGSAFMELQFYPPGFQPFNDAISCDRTRWCAALNIDSLACNFAFETCNPDCIEPVNFAYLQTNGVPAGPPSPQLTNVSTFTPNRYTLMMNGGDNLRVLITDTSSGLLTRVDDLTTGQSGYIVASAYNGFMNTDINTCDGTPFNFHPEYNTAAKQNMVPWAALEGGVLMQQEIGHFEKCASVTNSFPVATDDGPGQNFTDTHVFQTCNGGSEGAGQTGEGPCSFSGYCNNPTTEGGYGCPTNDFFTNAPCEFSDAGCMPAGTRFANVNGLGVAYTWPIAGCIGNVFQNGDLDFDGTSYQPDWPDGSVLHPTSFAYIGPFTTGNARYPSIQFETDVGASEIECDTDTGEGCTAQPDGAAFYPFWTLGHVNGTAIAPASPLAGNLHTCVWNFGNRIAGATKDDFGKADQYGSSDTAIFGGTLASDVLPNPQLSETC